MVAALFLWQAACRLGRREDGRSAPTKAERRVWRQQRNIFLLFFWAGCFWSGSIFHWLRPCSCGLLLVDCAAERMGGVFLLKLKAASGAEQPTPNQQPCCPANPAALEQAAASARYRGSAFGAATLGRSYRGSVTGAALLGQRYWDSDTGTTTLGQRYWGSRDNRSRQRSISWQCV